VQEVAQKYLAPSLRSVVLRQPARKSDSAAVKGAE